MIKGLKAPVNKKGKASVLNGVPPVKYAVFFLEIWPFYCLDLLI